MAKTFTVIDFDKYKDNTYDSTFVLNFPRRDKAKYDSAFFTIRLLKPITWRLYFQVWDNDRLLADWAQLSFDRSNELMPGYYRVATLPKVGHHYKINFSQKKRPDDYAVYKVDFREKPRLEGVFFREQEEALEDALLKQNPSDSDKMKGLPVTNWAKYQPETKVDSFVGFSGEKFPQWYPSDGLYVYSRYNTILFLYSGIGDSVALDYQLTPESIEADTLKAWKHTLPGNYLIKLTGIEPGEYRLKVRYSRFNSKISSYSIIIRPLWYQTSWVNWSEGFILGLSVILVPFFIFKRAQKARLRKKEQERAMLDLQMKSYRAQLNPHFIFNALTSIQSLINKQDTAGANRYLGEFSQLLRKTLDEQVTAFWTLQDELDLLKQYIGLEQLRFGLRYTVQVDAGIHTEQVEFPSMLLQPVVENAVRHGISGMAEKGQITITISGTNDHFSISITDNGVGFNTSEATQGNHGLRLTRERIQLFNSHNTGKITFSIASGKGNTTANFYLEHI